MAGRQEVYERIRNVVRDIPFGSVASYGQVAAAAGGCTARMVGYAMGNLPSGTDVPWHRVINSQGRISERVSGDGELRQQMLLEEEGVVVDARGRVNFDLFGWLR